MTFRNKGFGDAHCDSLSLGLSICHSAEEWSPTARLARQGSLHSKMPIRTQKRNSMWKIVQVNKTAPFVPARAVLRAAHLGFSCLPFGKVLCTGYIFGPLLDLHAPPSPLRRVRSIYRIYSPNLYLGSYTIDHRQKVAVTSKRKFGMKRVAAKAVNFSTIPFCKKNLHESNRDDGISPDTLF